MKTTDHHYDQTYFNEHYGALIGDPVYYQLLASYWKETIMAPLQRFRAATTGRMLDFGSGTGVVTGAIEGALAYDISDYARSFLRTRGREAFASVAEIPRGDCDILLCSHSLEHYEDPKGMLELFRELVRPDGHLILILPIDSDFTPTMAPDNNQHLYCWNFQSITNLLLLCQWQPLFADKIYGPFLLKTLGKWLPSGSAISIAQVAGRLKRAFPSMLVLAQSKSG